MAVAEKVEESQGTLDITFRGQSTPL